MHYAIIFIKNISKDQSENMAQNRTVRSQTPKSNRGQETPALNRPSRFLLVAKYYSCDKIKEEEDKTVHVAHIEEKNAYSVLV
jgi:hypothetical protein